MDQIVFKAKELTTDDLIKLMANTGYIVKPAELEFAKDNDLIKHLGCPMFGVHAFYVVFQDEHQDNQFICGKIFVGLNREGQLCAEYGGVPRFETNDADECLELFEKICN